MEEKGEKGLENCQVSSGQLDIQRSGLCTVERTLALESHRPGFVLFLHYHRMSGDVPNIIHSDLFNLLNSSGR